METVRLDPLTLKGDRGEGSDGPQLSGGAAEMPVTANLMDPPTSPVVPRQKADGPAWEE